MSEKDFIEIKRQYLLNEEGSIREGLNSMKDYARILHARDEEELDEIIKDIMEKTPIEQPFEDIDVIYEEE